MNLAVIRIRGVNRVSHPIERTLCQLHLYRKNFCAVVPGTPAFKGMLAKVKDYVTYGPIDDATYQSLFEKRGEEYHGHTQAHIEYGTKKYKPFFRLHPPRGGFEAIKKSYGLGGTLGFRGEKIKDLLVRML